MSWEEPIRHLSTNEAGPLRPEAVARQLFHAVFDDEREARQAAAEYDQLSRALATASRYGTPLAEQTYLSRLREATTGPMASREAQAVAVRGVLDEMREANRAAHSSPQARRAHLEIESYRPTDDLPALLETPDGRTRAEHAAYLHQVNPEARDLYERGAVVTGEAVIIPREGNSTPDPADQVRLGSLAHAVNTFAPLVGLAQAREKAAEFVALGRDIAGRTADGDTRLVVFQEFYRQIQRDEQGRFWPRAEQAVRLDKVLHDMRPLAAALREQEWTPAPVELVPLDAWERGWETRQRDTEHEQAGRLTQQLGETFERSQLAEHEGPERTAAATQLEELLQAHGTGSISYERLSLAGQPPRLPENSTPTETARLRYEVMPYLDAQLENGVPPALLLAHLGRQYAAETRQAHAAQVKELFAARASSDYPPPDSARAAQARALYTLHTLGVAGSAEQIRQAGFSAQERAAALDVVGGRLAQDYRAQVRQLQSFAALEQERDNLARAAVDYRDQQRATPEFQAHLAHLRTQETDNKQTAWRVSLAALLVSPEIARAQAANAAQHTATARGFSRLAGTEITDAATARVALAPDLRQMRATLQGLAAARATLDIPRTTRPDTRFANPLYVAVPAQSSLRLVAGSGQEYQLITAQTTKAGLKLHTYPSLHGPPLVAESPARTAELNFARDYVVYRLADDTTRLRNGNRLFREFDARLAEARTPVALRQTINEMRQENYARAQEPERFAGAEAEARAYGLPPRTPLNGAQMKQLLLAEAPAHYTSEMRELRREASLSARDKEERIKGLTQGQLQPSPALQLLLAEFGRTQAHQSAQTTRNIKAFLGDYLNPPTPERHRFSRHNLYELRQQLAPTERDYLYQVITQARSDAPQPAKRQHAAPLAPARELAPASAHQVAATVPARDAASAVSLDRKAELSPGPRDARPQAAQHSARLSANVPADLPAVLEQRITAYLLEVVNRDGATALAAPRAGREHAAQVSRLVKETFREQGVALAAYQLTEERIATVAGQLVDTLPHTLQQAYQRPTSLSRPASDRDALHEAATPARATHENPRDAVQHATRAAVVPLVEREITQAQETATPVYAQSRPATAGASPDVAPSHRAPEVVGPSVPPPPSRVGWRR